MIRSRKHMYAWATLVLLLLSACQKEKNSDDSGFGNGPEEFPRAQTLYVGGFDWSQPSTFNPLAGDPNWPIDGNIKLVYESLFAFDQNTGLLEPMLAESYAFNGQTVEVRLDPRARWSDGSPVRSEDVVYTFAMDSLLPTPRHSNWNYISGVKALDSLRLIFTLDKKHYNPLILLDMLSEVSILPRKVWAPVIQGAKGSGGPDLGKVLQFKNDQDVVASGPYTLFKYYPDKIVLKRNPSYWGNVKHQGRAPAPTYIIHSLYNGNNHFSSAMGKGNLDLSSIFMPRIWARSADSIRAWSLKEPYHVPGSIPTLFIGLSQAPFDDVAMRRALAHAIDFPKIKTLAVSNYTPAVQPGFILPFGVEAKYYSASDAAEFGYRFDLAKARTLLKDAGYSWNDKNQLLDRQGKKLREINLECPQGWTDWEDVIKVVIASFRQLGIDAKEKFVDYSVWDRDVKQGAFDLIMKTQTADLFPSTPWKRFEQAMYSRDNKPVGQMMYYNYGRYSNARADSLISLIPRLTDTTQLKMSYRELNRIFMQEIPVLPLMYRPTQYYQFSTRHWKNFPSEENPYAAPQNLMIGAGVKALWEIQPAH